MLMVSNYAVDEMTMLSPFNGDLLKPGNKVDSCILSRQHLTEAGNCQPGGWWNWWRVQAAYALMTHPIKLKNLHNPSRFFFFQGRGAETFQWPDGSVVHSAKIAAQVQSPWVYLYRISSLIYRGNICVFANLFLLTESSQHPSLPAWHKAIALLRNQ